MRKAKSITSPFTVLVTVICLSIVGLLLFPNLPLKLSPSQSMPSLNVAYSLNGATSKIIETEVTSRIEGMLARMTGVTSINSTSGDGWGNITISFDKHTNMESARFEASTLIRQAYPDLPNGTSYPTISVQTSNENEDDERQFMVFTINATNNATDISTKANEVFKSAFTDIKGIKSVDIYGAEPMEWTITYDADQLLALGLTENDVQTAFAQYKFSKTLGTLTLETDNANQQNIDLSDISLKLPNGNHITLNKLAKLEYKEAEPTGYYRINGLNTIYLAFTATAQANQLELSRQILQRIAEVRTQLPSGYELHKNYDASEYISTELNKIIRRTILTVVILLLFVFLTTFSWRYMIVVITSLTCNLAIAFIAYYLMGIELHLYSLAGITISLNLIIDNTIIMADHWRREHNLSAILPIVAATFTSIAALGITFFLDEQLRLNLMDFALVSIINLLVSVAIALWLVPALLELQHADAKPKRQIKRLRMASKFNRMYKKYVLFAVNHRVWAVVILVWALGIPLYLLPSNISGNSLFARAYNNTLGSEVYQKKIKPVTDVVFGGTLRLFSEKVYSGSYWSRNNEIVLQVQSSLPYGSTLAQMDELIRKMESYISTFSEVSQFQTNIYSSQQANISIYFTPKARRSAFPYMLKSNIISKALQLGGGSWSVYGLPDNGFSNDVFESAGSYCIKMLGYNYEQLLVLADSIRNNLLTYKRINNVEINSRFSYTKSDYEEFHLEPNTQFMAQQGISIEQFFAALNANNGGKSQVGTLFSSGRTEAIILTSSHYNSRLVWDMLNKPIVLNNRKYKIGELCTLTKTQAPQMVEKENQQYRICLQYDYIGSSKKGQKVTKTVVDTYKPRMPLGYTIDTDGWDYYGWGNGNSSYYLLLALVVAVIIFIIAILFNSLRLPIVTIAIIPISYIGLFLTFYLFSINFDQGGLAALILLCGITVNSSIYIINEFRKPQKKSVLQAYIKAYSVKIIPILLTVISTALGFVPFMCGEKEGFWFPLSVGTIGGLAFSLVGILLFLPPFCIRKKDINR